MHDEARIKAVFQQYDKDSNGTISKEEMTQALHHLHLPNSDRDVKLAIKEMDVDGDSAIEFDEFKSHCFRKDREIKKMFESIDSDKSGFVTAKVCSSVSYFFLLYWIFASVN
jgi:Ca2+-binding EF-hand superfamily protein